MPYILSISSVALRLCGKFAVTRLILIQSH
jgi:hypothetical protein